MTKPFRASFTILSAWESGQWERAVEMYFKLSKFTTEAMAAGKNKHEEWQQHIEQYKRLPAAFGEIQLAAPQCEYKIVTRLHDWLEVVIVPDCFDSPTLYEFKYSQRNSNVFAQTKQVPLYAAMLIANDIPIEKGVIWRQKPMSDESEMSIVWITDTLITEAIEWLETYASEMHHYLQKNDLYEKFNP